MNEIDSKLLIAAKSIKFMLKEDFHDRAISPTSISFDEEIKNRQKLNNCKEENGFKWIYTIVESNGKFYFAAPTVSDEEARERKSWYFYPYEDIPEEFKKPLKKEASLLLNIQINGELLDLLLLQKLSWWKSISCLC
jgi:hypothetical protein